ncbi:MAG: SIMPL domain-containing protein [Paracoccaceae bacterium]
MPPKFMYGIVITALAVTIGANAPRADESRIYPAGEIKVSGLGQVDTAPDMAVITIGVTQEGKDAAKAMSQANTAMTDVLAELRALGLDQTQLQTRDLSLQPVWSNRAQQSDEPARITGYVASNTLAIRVLDLDRLGPVLDTVLASGANQFNGLRFGFEDASDLQSQARKAAVQDARRKAGELAGAAGVELGPVVIIVEGQGNRPAPFSREALASYAENAVATGELTVSVSVHMVFEIADQN